MARDDLGDFMASLLGTGRSETPETPPTSQGVSPENRVFPLYGGPGETPETPETPPKCESLSAAQKTPPAQPLTHAQRQTVTRWLVRIECSPAEIAQTLRDCEADPQALAHCLRRAADPAWLFGGADDPAPAPLPAIVQSCANCQHCHPAALKLDAKWERDSRFWCDQPDTPAPGAIPARRGHACRQWAHRTTIHSNLGGTP